MLLFLFCIVFFGHLIEFPFLQFCLCLYPVDFLFISTEYEVYDTICFTCSGVRPGDFGCPVICAGGVVARSLAMMSTVQTFAVDDSRWMTYSILRRSAPYRTIPEQITKQRSFPNSRPSWVLLGATTHYRSIDTTIELKI